MPSKSTLFILTASAVISWLPSGPSWAASSDAVSTLVAAPPLPSPAPVWVHPPEAVRTAVAALHDACAAWPKQVPLVREPASSPASEADASYVTACSLALDPFSFGQFSLLAGGALGAAAAGIAVLVFKVANILLFWLVDLVGRGMNALSDRRRRRANGWVD